MFDGKLDDWPATPLLVTASAADWNSSTVEYGGPEDVSGELWLAWDATNLYVAIKVRDSKLVRVPSADEIDRFGDSVVFSIAAEGAKEPNEFAIALMSSGPPRVFRTAPASLAREMKAMQCAVDPRADEGGGWRTVYEMAFPWSELAGLRPLAGERAKVTLAVSDDDGDGGEGFPRAVGDGYPCQESDPRRRATGAASSQRRPRRKSRLPRARRRGVVIRRRD